MARRSVSQLAAWTRPVDNSYRLSQNGRLRWNESIGLGLSLKKDNQVVIFLGITTGGLPDPTRANAGRFDWLERRTLPGDRASRVRYHRGLRPGLVDLRAYGWHRVFGRASSHPAQQIADQGGATHVGVHRLTKGRRKRHPPLPWVAPQRANKAEATGTEERVP